MILLFLALIFGIAVLIFLIACMARAKRTGNSRLLSVLRILIAIETAAYIVIFVMVIIRTMAS